MILRCQPTWKISQKSLYKIDITLILLRSYSTLSVICLIIMTIFSVGHRGLDLMVVEFTTTYRYAISASHHKSWVFESRSWRGVLDTTLCDKVYQWLAAGGLFSPGTPVSSINKTDRHDITELLLKVALNIITLTLKP